MTEQLQRFIQLLRGIFELDKADLDFGIYRIMNIRKNEIERFLNHGLPVKVQEALKPFAADTAEIEAKIKAIETQCDSVGVEVSKSRMAEEYARLKGELIGGVDLSGMEADVYSALYSFFNRYYEEGDFISKRRYKEGVYAIPYEGEEVKLYWANQDQYYIKTSENFKDYTFVAEGYNIHFRLVDATTEQNNNKEAADAKRVFMLYTETDKSPEIKTFEFDADKKEVIIRFIFDVPADKKFNYAADNAQKITAWIVNSAKPLISTLLAPISKDPKKPQTLIEKHLSSYVAKNTFDYFIHKDLRGFLSRELDFYIKNEVIHIDDIDTADEKRADKWLARVRAIKRVGRVLIDFLAQIEDFQKKLWLKKKFVISCDYCITLDRIPEKFYEEIAQNDAQREEWVRVVSIDIIKKGVIDTGALKYDSAHTPDSTPLPVEFLKENQYLMVDTKFFSSDFKERLLSEFDGLDAQCDGLLFHSENFHALNFMQNKYKEQVKCIYIDPPYNTGGDGFIYRDNYQHSSWLSMMNDRLPLAFNIGSSDGIIGISLDHNELSRNEILITQHRGEYALKNTITVARVKKNIKEREYVKSLNWEQSYIQLFACSSDALIDVPKKKHTSKRKEEVWHDFDVPGVRPTMEYEIFGKKPPVGRHWMYSKINADKMLAEGNIRSTTTRCGIQYKVPDIGGILVGTDWTDIIEGDPDGGITTSKNPKLIERFIQLVPNGKNITVTDFFAGSGTTAHAVINLNREDGGKRKYILVEMGDHFDKVLKPRIQKVVFSEKWKDGVPQLISPKIVKHNAPVVSEDEFHFEAKDVPPTIKDNPTVDSENKFNGVSQIVKYMVLESYEDALSNISLLSEEESNAMGLRFGDEYLIKYMLDVEAKGSILNLAAFNDPFDYQLNVTEKNETRRVKVDVIETFNYLIGLNVEKIYARRIFRAAPDAAGGYEGAVKLSLETHGNYLFRQAEGKLPDGRRALIIWRNVTENIHESNAALDAYFLRYRINPLDREYDVIYVNGDNNLENLKTDAENWKVRLIETEFKKRMFEEM